MSGGEWDYVYGKFYDVAVRLAESKSPLRRALGNHIELIAKAMHDIEWVDSGDTEPGSEREAIEAVFGGLAESKEIEILIADGREIVEQLKELGV